MFRKYYEGRMTERNSTRRQYSIFNHKSEGFIFRPNELNPQSLILNSEQKNALTIDISIKLLCHINEGVLNCSVSYQSSTGKNRETCFSDFRFR